MPDESTPPAEVLVPVEQAAVPFYGRDLVAVRLPDGRIAAVLRWLCEGMQLDIQAQVRRIRRKTALRDDLVTVRVETSGGPQSMPALVLHGLLGWLYTIDESRVSDTSREAVIAFQRECTDVLAQYFAERPARLPGPTTLVPAEPITRPEAPGDHATPEEWLEFHRQMVRVIEWQQDVVRWQQRVESRQDEVDERMESVEQVIRLVPDLIERLGPQTLTPEHQRTVQNAAKRLHDVGGYAFGTVYTDLGAYFRVAKYDQIPESRWSEVVEWFRVRIQAAEQRQKPH
jgi:hypothetical protein